MPTLKSGWNTFFHLRKKVKIKVNIKVNVDEVISLLFLNVDFDTSCYMMKNQG